MEQVKVFLYSIGLGVFFILLFDLFRLMRRKKKTRDAMVYLQDVIYVVMVAMMIIASTFMINHGELRGYMVIGYILGGMIYLLLFSHLFYQKGCWILDIIEKSLKIVSHRIKDLWKKIIKTKKNNQNQAGF